jgi:membrane fusion protein (multidrug efflux system)
MVRALIENQESLLRPGMLMTVNIVTDARQALVIPESAYIQVGGDTYVYIAGKDGLAHRRPIRIGSRRIGYVEVVEGLREGEVIITEGGFKLRDQSPYGLESGARLDMEMSGQKQGIEKQSGDNVVI